MAIRDILSTMNNIGALRGAIQQVKSYGTFINASLGEKGSLLTSDEIAILDNIDSKFADYLVQLDNMENIALPTMTVRPIIVEEK
jgi:hypothetical protein